MTTQPVPPDGPIPEAKDSAPALGLALSGGGFRAAAFHLGVLRGLRAGGRLESVRAISGVSGGALLAAAWVATGRDDLDAFTARMRAFLSRDLKRRVLWAALRPDRLLRLAAQPSYSLTEVLADVLDRELFRGRTLGGLRDVTPRLVLSATCVNHGTGWRFTPERIGDWVLSTRDRDTLAAFPLARAVAASAAFPGGLMPVVLGGAEVFGRHEAAPREVLLTDGGVDDNLGVSGLAQEELGELVVSDGSLPFDVMPRPLDRFGLRLPWRLLALVAASALVAWSVARAQPLAAVLALAGVAAWLALTRLRFALWLFGSVVMRGQRRGLLRRVFGDRDRRPVHYFGLATALAIESERSLRAAGIDLERLRRARTDLCLRRHEVDGLIALGEALVRDRR
jgi:predicted acylesterase/phospholipase RssA